MLIRLALFGGLLSVLTFIHFTIDWITQSHAEAMVKHNNPYIRAKHCLIYTSPFALLLACINLPLLQWLFCVNLLFWSHFYLDTYHGVYLWAKYIRRPPEMTEPRKRVEVDGYITLLEPDPKAGFVEFIQTTLGKILMISLDQIFHICFLVPVAWMMLHHIKI